MAAPERYAGSIEHCRKGKILLFTSTYITVADPQYVMISYGTAGSQLISHPHRGPKQYVAGIRADEA